MNVNKVSLDNFRNYDKALFNFSDGLNVIEGLNTVGKTNLVEAVYFCAFGKSPRTPRDKELIRWGQDRAAVSLYANKKRRGTRIDVLLSGGEKRIAVDGAGIAKLSELVGVLNVIYFSPDELKMIKEGPQERRRFMDISLCQQSRAYLTALTDYNKALQNRNALLRSGGSFSYMEKTVPIWDDGLARTGAVIVEKRREFLRYLLPFVDETHRSLAGVQEGLKVEYESPASQENTQKSLLDALAASLEKDYRLGYTTVGPHRDDISVKGNEVDLRSFGSQGQQRTAALAIKLAEAVCMEEKSGEKPIMILDDVLSELDPNRRESLLRSTARLQTLLTCTDFADSEEFVKNRIFINPR